MNRALHSPAYGENPSTDQHSHSHCVNHIGGHTLFRIPGFIHRAVGMKKVDALAQHYGNWHGGIVPIPERITPENIESLRDFDFVFVSIDDGPSRLTIIDWLSANAIPFVDCGMGLNRSLVGLNGVVRITGTERAAFEQTVNTPYLPTTNPENGEYRKQAQVAELNALNAIFAVIRFKQHFEFNDRLSDAFPPPNPLHYAGLICSLITWLSTAPDKGYIIPVKSLKEMVDAEGFEPTTR
jgi:hypothetical protein